jgi:hypothetical protein
VDVFAVRARILEATHLEAALTGVADEIRRLCGAERLTVYRVERKGTDATLVSVLQSGLERFREIKLPVSAGRSIASHAAATRKAVNIADAYDVRELASFDPALMFLKAVDQKTGFRTRQVLAVPFPSDSQQALSGVLQLINRVEPGAFPRFAQETATFLADAIAALMERTGSVKELVKLAGHHDPKARGYAAAMLRNFSGAQAEEALLSLVRDGYLDVAATAAGSLAHMGCVRAAQSILERMPAGDALLRHPAAQLRAFPDALAPWRMKRRSASVPSRPGERTGKRKNDSNTSVHAGKQLSARKRREGLGSTHCARRLATRWPKIRRKAQGVLAKSCCWSIAIASPGSGDCIGRPAQATCGLRTTPSTCAGSARCRDRATSPRTASFSKSSPGYGNPTFRPRPGMS